MGCDLGAVAAMRWSWTFVCLLIAALTGGCAHWRPPSAEGPAPVLLLSLDGFRWDYCDLYPAQTPNLRALAKEGCRAEGLIPVFPSHTFPNHYTIVTGLRPIRHGIVNNVFFDSARGGVFNYKLPTHARDPYWWGGEPIWITARRQGRPSACYFWPGAEVVRPDVLPTFNKPYDYKIPFATRLDELMRWLQLPSGERPAVIAFYLEETNSTGHNFGPGSAELRAAVQMLDQRVGEIRERARASGVALNLVIVSDHGMAPTEGATRTTILDEILDLKLVQVDFEGAVVGLRPRDGDVPALRSRLAALPAHYRVYATKELPRHFHMTEHHRLPPLWIIPDEGWRVQRRSSFQVTGDANLKGDHGYDPALPSMHGIFIASGPAFRRGVRVGRVENLHVYNLLCAAAKLTPAPNDGDNRLVKAALRR